MQTWRKEGYEESLTHRALACTPSSWDDIQKRGHDHPLSVELRAIFAEEMALPDKPNWVQELIDRMITMLPTCGHYAFPKPLVQIAQAIRHERCPAFVCGCYTADARRKQLLATYVFCLDAWLKRAPLDVAAAELAMRESLGKDWSQIVEDVYGTLGEHSPQKTLLVQRLIHRLRWWIKALIWCNDKRDRFLLDVYSGDLRGDEADWGSYGNSPFGDPFFTERELPSVKALAQTIRETVPEGDRLLELIESTWLCAPKAFRYVEKLVFRIGSIDSDVPMTEEPSILQCEDTYPDVASHGRWYCSFIASIDDWLADERGGHAPFGESTPLKAWLVRLLRLKLKLYEQFNNFGNLVGARPSGKRGHATVPGERATQ